MAGVNASRAGLAQNVTDALENARLIGYNGEGEVCVWTGGYSFNCYDAARDWQETRHFTSGDMVDHDNVEKARERMRMGGFDPIEP